LRANLLRVGVGAEIITADVLEWDGGLFDAVLLDAPCSATGTIRRHPDVPWTRRETDIPALAAVQRRMIARAVELVKPEGTLIYCVCSLEPEEGIDIVTALLREEPRIRRRPIAPGEVHIPGEWLTADGDLRTLPCQLSDRDPTMAGLDGFYAARLQRF
jgi:16S rRNA (cytosine967-C5)-methyltransferase